MKRLTILILIGFAGLLASCGSSRTSSAQPELNQVYSMVVSPTQMTLSSGDWATITAKVELSVNNGTPQVVSPQPAIKFYSSDPRITISPAGEVCAGQWTGALPGEAGYVTCSPATTLPSGPVAVYAQDASHGVKASVFVSVHARAAGITLSAPSWGTRTCISQTNQVQYVAAAVDSSGNPIPSCTASPGAPGCIQDNDYTWTTDNAGVAQVSTFGVVVANNPGLTNVIATLNGTVGELTFVTCPPKSIVLTTSIFTGLTPIPPFSTDDLTLNIGDQKYVNATMVDVNGNPLSSPPLTNITSNPLTSSITTGALPLSSQLRANTAGRFTIMAACEPPSCNPATGNFLLPNGTPETSEAAGFGYPVYSNVIGITVQGSTSSDVLVTGQSFTNGTAANELLVFSSDSLTLAEPPVALANPPNSLVVAPNGAKAYLGSSAGLMMVDLTTFQASSASQLFPVVGEPTTPPTPITGTVLGVSADSRYVIVSDVANSMVFLVDTTGTKTTTEYRNLPNISAVAFAGDGSNIWIGGDAGVYVFQADTFVPILTNLSTHVTSLAWMPDGQSFFASGDQLIDYSACNNENPLTPATNLVSTVPQGLSTTAIGGVPHLLGLDGSEWFDYSVSSGAQVPSQPDAQALSIPPLVANGSGDVCPPTVAVNAPVAVATTLPCTAQQVSFSPTLEEEFVTGVAKEEFVNGVATSTCATSEQVIHGYNAVTQSPISLTTTNPVVPLSGGVLNDGSKLFFGTFDSTNGGLLHRIDLSLGTEDITPVPVTSLAGTVTLIPSFVAVVPK